MRYNLFTLIHKGLRHALQRMVWTAGKLDVGSTAEKQAFFREFDQIVIALNRHAADEDTFIQPLIDECAPEIGAELEKQHTHSEELLAELVKMADAIKSASQVTDGTYSAWQSFIDALNRFTGDYFLHLYHEESIAMPRLWEHYDDESLKTTALRLRSAVPPEVQSIFETYMIPAINVHERSFMLHAIKQSAPEPVFREVCGKFERLLPAAEWEELQRKLSAMQ